MEPMPWPPKPPPLPPPLPPGRRGWADDYPAPPPTSPVLPPLPWWRRNLPLVITGVVLTLLLLASGGVWWYADRKEKISRLPPSFVETPDQKYRDTSLVFADSGN